MRGKSLDRTFDQALDFYPTLNNVIYPSFYSIGLFEIQTLQSRNQ